eukprot:scaffold8013_cov139-Amphora_coffeaeformis.AAC.8
MCRGSVAAAAAAHRDDCWDPTASPVDDKSHRHVVGDVDATTMEKDSSLPFWSDEKHWMN